MATTAEYGLGEFAFPRGWFAVANGNDVVRFSRQLSPARQKVVCAYVAIAGDKRRA